MADLTSIRRSAANLSQTASNEALSAAEVAKTDALKKRARSRPDCSRKLHMTFTHRFSRSLSCTMTVIDQPPVGGARYIQSIEWTGRPKPKHIREYVRWRHVVSAHLAELWNFRIMEAIETAPRTWEFWGYAPGEAPKLLEKISTL